MSAPNAAERAAVARGAARLDMTIPDWWERIDLDVLQIGRCGDCICGQLGAETDLDLDPATRFFRGLRMVGVPREDAAEFGFNDTVGMCYCGLAEAWRELIAARRAAAQHAGGNCAWCGAALQPGEPEVCTDCLGRGLPHTPALETAR